MESHCNIPCIKPHVAQCQPYSSTSMFRSSFTHKLKFCIPFLMHPSYNPPLSKLHPLFQIFLHSSCAGLKSNQIKRIEHTQSHLSSMASWLHSQALPFGSQNCNSSPMLKQKQSHIHTPHKRVSFELQS
jgi:hypothetical protein